MGGCSKEERRHVLPHTASMSAAPNSANLAMYLKRYTLSVYRRSRSICSATMTFPSEGGLDCGVAIVRYGCTLLFIEEIKKLKLLKVWMLL